MRRPFGADADEPLDTNGSSMHSHTLGIFLSLVLSSFERTYTLKFSDKWMTTTMPSARWRSYAFEPTRKNHIYNTRMVVPDRSSDAVPVIATDQHRADGTVALPGDTTAASVSRSDGPLAGRDRQTMRLIMMHI
jgi:hypothetical protein